MNNSSGENAIPYNTSPQCVTDVEKALLNNRFALMNLALRGEKQKKQGQE